MANRRDLHVGISADDEGFASAFKDAQDKAQNLDQELGKLARQQAVQEKAMGRASDATRRFATEQEKAALQARKMGQQVQQASDRAEAATRRAEAAAKAYERGLIDEATAAKAAANAEKAVERAVIKSAEADVAAKESADKVAKARLEAARAADEQAKQERQVARDSALAAAAEELGALKASGAVKQHNSLLRDLKSSFGDVEKLGGEAFKEIETTGQKAATSIEEMAQNFTVLGAGGPALLGPLLVLLQTIPALVSATAGAVALGLGGALSFIAIKAQASNKDVQAAFSGTVSHIKASLQQITTPFHATLLNLAADARGAFDSLTPALSKAFAAMAPALSRFGDLFARSLSRLNPAITSIGTAFSRVLGALGPQMGKIMNNLGTGIKAITDAAAANPGALASLVIDLSYLVRIIGDGIGFVTRFSSVFTTLFEAFNAVAAGPIGVVLLGLSKIGSAFGFGGKQAKSFSAAMTGTGTATTSTVQATTQLLTAQQVAKTSTDQLKASLDKLTGANQTAFDAQTSYVEALAAANKQAKASNAGIKGNSAAVVQNRQALSQLATAIKADLGGKSADQVEKMRQSFIHAAEGMGVSKSAAEALARSLLGIKPVKLSANDAEFLSKLHNAQGLKINPKTGYLLGNNANYFNAWLKANGLRISPKTGELLGNNADYYNKWLKANGLHIDTKTGKIVGNTAAFWNAVHAIPSTIGTRYINVQYTGARAVRPELRAEGGYIDGRGYASGGSVQRFPTGGSVVGPGTGTSDSIPAMLSNGEYVINAAATAAFRPLLDAINYGARVPVPAAVASGASGGSAQPIQVEQTFVNQVPDPSLIARESARELAWTLGVVR